MTIRAYSIQVSSTDPRALADVAEFLLGYTGAPGPSNLVVNASVTDVQMRETDTALIDTKAMTLQQLVALKEER